MGRIRDRSQGVKVIDVGYLSVAFLLLLRCFRYNA